MFPHRSHFRQRCEPSLNISEHRLLGCRLPVVEAAVSAASARGFSLSGYHLEMLPYDLGDAFIRVRFSPIGVWLVRFVVELDTQTLRFHRLVQLE
jgi:hypothetical protein